MSNSSLGVVVCGSLQGKEKLEDTKGAIRSRTPKKGRQCNGQTNKGQKDKKTSTKHYTEK